VEAKDNPFEGWTRVESTSQPFGESRGGKVDVAYHPPAFLPDATPCTGMLDVSTLHKRGESAQISCLSAAEFVDQFWFGPWAAFTEHRREARRQERRVEFFLQNRMATRIQAVFHGRRDRARAELLQVIPHHETFSTTIQPPYSSTKG
jgi:hypothetical protein